MAIGTMEVFWLGVSALCMAIAVWFFPDLSIGAQLLLYALFAVVTLVVWRKYYKKTDLNFRIGQSQGEEIGRVGTISQTCGPNQNGRIRFTLGVMGSKEWTAIADETIEIGQEAKIVAVVGNAVKVIPDL